MDLESNTITTVTTRAINPAELFNYGDYVFVSNNGFRADNTIFKIDIAFHPIVDTIAVNRGPADMLESAQKFSLGSV